MKAVLIVTIIIVFRSSVQRAAEWTTTFPVAAATVAEFMAAVTTVITLDI